MATKSVIEIDILDEKFQAFAKEFDKLQKAVKATSADSKKISEEAEKAGSKFQRYWKQLADQQKTFNKELKDSATGLTNVERTTANIARNMASSAISVAKWLTLGAIGGGFGLGGLAASASDVRRQAQGFGVSTGQLRAANVNFGRYINPEAALGNIADIQSDLSRRQILGRLGGAPGQNPADMLSTVMTNAVRQFKAGGQTSQFAEAMGLTQVFSLEELRRISSLTEDELKKTIDQFKADRELLAVDDTTSRAWQDFWVQLKRSGNTIETSFIKNLKELTPELIKISDAVAKALDAFLGSDRVKQALDDFAKYLSSPEFKQDVGVFLTALKRLGEATYNAAIFFGLIDKKAQVTPAEVEDTRKTLPFWMPDYAVKGVAQDRKDKRLQAIDYFTKQGWTSTQAIGLTANLERESGFDPKALGDSGKAMGIAQWHPDRQAEFEKLFKHSIKNSTFEEQLAFVNYELQNNERDAGAQLRRATNITEATRAGIAYERPRNPDQELADRLRIAQSIQLNVTTSTGADINANAAAAPGANNR